MINPDCLVYESIRRKDGLNYLFFEKGFKKLSLKEVRLRLGDLQGKNTARICCAFGSDYTPKPESYGICFQPIARTKMQEEYFSSEDVEAFIAPFKQEVNKILNNNALE